MRAATSLTSIPQVWRWRGAADHAEVVGRPVADFLPSAARARATALIRWILAKGHPVHARRWTLRRLDGAPVTVEVNASPISHQGRPALQLELQDVSARAADEDALRESERRFHAVFADSPVAMALSDERGLWVDVNNAFCDLYGRSRDQLLGVGAEDFAHPDDRILIAGSEQGQLASPDGIHRMEGRFLRPDGELRWSSISITATPGPQGQPWTLAVVQDITHRRADEEALRQSEAELAAIADVARCVQSGADPRPVIAASVRRLAGADAAAVLEARDGTLIVTAGDGAVAGSAGGLTDTSMAGQVWCTGQRLFVPDVSRHPTIGRPIEVPDRSVSALWEPVIVSGSVQALLVVSWMSRVDEPTAGATRALRLMAEEAATSLHATRLRRDLELSATTDPLTGALNRRAWDSRLSECARAARVTGAPLTVAIVDLDHFKVFNDTYGHAEGDVLLRDFAASARACLRKNDLFARWGGEEFSIALPDVDPVTARRILDRIRVGVSRNQTCSIGYTTWDPGEPVNASIARADAALYEAKRNGRNRLGQRPPTARD